MPISVFAGVAPLCPSFDALIRDVWGVLMDGVESYPEALPCLARLRAAGKRVVLLSNAPRRESLVEARLASIGIASTHYDRIVSSGEATRAALERRLLPAIAGLGRRYFFLGPDRDLGLLAGLDYRRVEAVDQADFVLDVGTFEDFDAIERFDDLLARARARALPLICANPDHEIVRRGGERLLCAGAIAARYQAQGGQAIYFGKPHPAIYGTCFEALAAIDPAIAPARVLALGDNLETDIAGAKRAGLRTGLVLGGVLADELARVGARPVPGVAPKAEAVERVCAAHGVFPDLAIPAFSW